ncbi:MAG: hypothetical protein ACRC5M_06015 [Anaeroplasmataceae bacterium]
MNHNTLQLIENSQIILRNCLENLFTEDFTKKDIKLAIEEDNQKDSQYQLFFNKKDITNLDLQGYLKLLAFNQTIIKCLEKKNDKVQLSRIRMYTNNAMNFRNNLAHKKNDFINTLNKKKILEILLTFLFLIESLKVYPSVISHYSKLNKYIDDNIEINTKSEHDISKLVKKYFSYVTIEQFVKVCIKHKIDLIDNHKMIIVLNLDKTIQILEKDLIKYKDKVKTDVSNDEKKSKTLKSNKSKALNTSTKKTSAVKTKKTK